MVPGGPGAGGARGGGCRSGERMLRGWPQCLGGCRRPPLRRGPELLPQAPKPHQVRPAFLYLGDQVCLSVMENLGPVEAP